MIIIDATALSLTLKDAKKLAAEYEARGFKVRIV